MITLGLDLGPNSIGWALIDEQFNKIIRTGVRIFPEGVDRDQQGGEQSKSQTRRTARGTRRLLARRAKRKHRLLAVLVEAGLLPEDDDALEELLDTNPYPLRKRCRNERLEQFEIGRVLWHLNQRRGFLSNRKTDRSDSEVKGMLAEIGELRSTLTDRKMTLGEYLASIGNRFSHATSSEVDRIRRRHTRREMYLEEFEALWHEQQQHYPEVLTEDLKRRLYNPQQDHKWMCRGLIFGQRRVYWPKSVIGRCDLERKEKRCPRALLAAQRFRICQEVNNLRIIDRSTGEERRLRHDEQQALYSYLDTAKKRTFDQIRKHKKLGFPLPDAVQFNFERGGRKHLQGNETNAALGSKKSLGRRWNDLSADTQDRIVDILINEELEDEALRRLVEECRLSADEARAALGANLPEGHMNYSLLAISRLLPHLQRGLNLIGNDPSDSAIHAAGYLRPDEREVKKHEFLPSTPDLPNPIVRQALIEVRKIVNAILREYVYRGGATLGLIRVELAREAKRSFEERRELLFEQLDRRRAREVAREEIEKIGVKPTLAAIQRYLLWKEQRGLCPYSQTSIGLAELFTAEVDVDHILPRWRSLDDSMANKVVCRRRENDRKGDQTPYEWLAEREPERYERVLQVADMLPGNKPLKFRSTEINLDDFVNRQFTDTAYISRCVTQYLQSIGVSIETTRGGLTAELRHWWGLNNILDPEGRGRKMRNDHRHHAIDALVIALMTRKRLHALANARGRNMPPPWDGFLDQARESILSINVSHRALKRLRGALHEATFYGRTAKERLHSTSENRPWAKTWIEDEDAYVRRKPITEVKNAKHLEKVRDPAIRAILRDHLSRQGIDPTKTATFPATVFKGENTPRMPSGVPIRKVRMIERSETFRRVSERRSYHFVKPGSNHHTVYRRRDSGEWSAEVIPMWDAAVRGRNGLELVERVARNGSDFIMSMTVGEMFQFRDENGNDSLCVVRKIDQRSKRVHYKSHIDAREASDINKENQYLSPKNMAECDARKVTIDPLGRIRWAND